MSFTRPIDSESDKEAEHLTRSIFVRTSQLLFLGEPAFTFYYTLNDLFNWVNPLLSSLAILGLCAVFWYPHNFLIASHLFALIYLGWCLTAKHISVDPIGTRSEEQVRANQLRMLENDPIDPRQLSESVQRYFSFAASQGVNQITGTNAIRNTLGSLDRWIARFEFYHTIIGWENIARTLMVVHYIVFSLVAAFYLPLTHYILLAASVGLLYRTGILMYLQAIVLWSSESVRHFFE
eukprot:TRINITY_DN2327_c0_g1_i1.p1 TRINITY_DN2327_c0_g1~~TRINITY_DN2327_c0_g1_i1.p1  ORF type:complete len:236 (+),score=28.71 TRINITY_DN2327_c0_g1_i1:154-861(+)